MLRPLGFAWHGQPVVFLFFPSQFLFQCARPCRRSSTVEHLFCKQAVAGSNPVAGSMLRNAKHALRSQRRSRAGAISGPLPPPKTFFPARWCNGSTNDSDSFCLGSNPSRAAIQFLRRDGGRARQKSPKRPGVRANHAAISPSNAQVS